MTAAGTAAPQRWVAVFDLDGTLTWHDTMRLFVLSYLRRHPWRALRLWRMPIALCAFVAGQHDRGALKSSVIRMVMGGASRGDMDDCAESFVNALHSRGRFRSAALAVIEAHRAAGDHLVLLSASPDLYVPRIGHLLGFERTLCTEIRWRGDRLEGALVGVNCRGAEKLRRLHLLRAQYPALPFVAYGDSAADLDHMRHADRALLVNGNSSARVLAAHWGIPTSNWT